MIIYIVKSAEEYEEAYLIKAFTNKDKAEDFADKLNTNRNEQDSEVYFVSELEADLEG